LSKEPAIDRELGKGREKERRSGWGKRELGEKRGTNARPKEVR